jgi:hypothetical protein
MTAANLALNLDPFGKGRKAVPDSVQKVVPDVDELVERAYGEYLRIPGSGFFYETEELVSRTAIIKDKSALNPSQIELLLERIIEEYPAEIVSYRVTGLFLTALIQNSYTYGHYNNFRLATAGSKIGLIGHRLKGTKKDRIVLTIEGNTGHDCGEMARYSKFNIYGNVDADCGWEAKYSDFDIHGNAGEGCGINAEHSNFNIYGNAAEYCGSYAECSRFIVHNPELFGSLRCVLSSTNKLSLVDDAGNVIKRSYLSRLSRNSPGHQEI